jgi:creatinine amidohydrolase/Fe(II)-dependent formamide hydrolase-like protein
LQGASAFQKLLDEQREGRIRVFVIWEPVLPTDLAAPSTMTLKRIPDGRASQYWDKEHLVSKSIGEKDGVIWDYVAVYEQGKLWDKAAPEPTYSNEPVIHVLDETREAIKNLLPENRK